MTLTDADIEEAKEIIAELRKVTHPSPLDYWMGNKANAMQVCNNAADWIERRLR